MVVRETCAKSILSRSGIEGIRYCINPYTGCAHGCSYCYASFMKKFTGHREAWGDFVDVKVNAPALLNKQIKRAENGLIMFSSVTDPYQPLEAKYGLTRGCLEVLSATSFPTDILTKSPLILRDVDLLKRFENISAGITVTTDDDAVRNVFEPKAPPVEMRIKALENLYKNGISTYAFIGPVLPMNPEELAQKIGPYIDTVLIDKMNYSWKTAGIYKEIDRRDWLEKDFLSDVMGRLKRGFKGKDVVSC